MADLDTSIPRLSVATLGSARIGTAKFSYDRRRLRPRIVHLGLGAFFRAHGALFTEDVLVDGGGDWGIIGASLKRPEQRNRAAGLFVYNGGKRSERPEGPHCRLPSECPGRA